MAKNRIYFLHYLMLGILAGLTIYIFVYQFYFTREPVRALSVEEEWANQFLELARRGV